AMIAMIVMTGVVTVVEAHVIIVAVMTEAVITEIAMIEIVMTDLQEIIKKNNFLKFLNISLLKRFQEAFFMEFIIFFCVRDCSEKPGMTNGNEDLQRKARSHGHREKRPHRKISVSFVTFPLLFTYNKHKDYSY